MALAILPKNKNDLILRSKNLSFQIKSVTELAMQSYLRNRTPRFQHGASRLTVTSPAAVRW